MSESEEQFREEPSTETTNSNLQLLMIHWLSMRLARGASVQTGCADRRSGQRDCAGHGWLRPAGRPPETGQTDSFSRVKLHQIKLILLEAVTDLTSAGSSLAGSDVTPVGSGQGLAPAGERCRGHTLIHVKPQ